MINGKIIMSGISIIASLVLLSGATLAYFTANASSEGNTFAAGEMNIDIRDQNLNTAFVNELLATGWQPGDETLVEFDVRNRGTLPINLSGLATGTWGQSELDSQDKVKVVKVERWNGSSWETLKNDSGGISGVFYYTSNGNPGGTQFAVAPGERAQLRLTVKFVETAGNDFQGKTFTATIQIAGKQVGAPW